MDGSDSVPIDADHAPLVEPLGRRVGAWDVEVGRHVAQQVFADRTAVVELELNIVEVNVAISPYIRIIY
jgi:hypothetical protein